MIYKKLNFREEYTPLTVFIFRSLLKCKPQKKKTGTKVNSIVVNCTVKNEDILIVNWTNINQLILCVQTSLSGKISLFKIILNNHHFVFNVESFPCPHVDILSSLVVLYHTLCACYNWY